MSMISTIIEGDTEMPMHDPAHPGDIIREECLLPLGLSVTAAAEGLGVSRKTLSALLNGHAGVSPEMAIRLEKAGWSRVGVVEAAIGVRSLARAEAGGYD